MGGVIESNLSWIPPNPDQPLCNIPPLIILSTLSLGLNIEPNLIHTPWAHILYTLSAVTSWGVNITR
jgi:hypothetical protein